jgi:hypothetical protein
MIRRMTYAFGVCVVLAALSAAGASAAGAGTETTTSHETEAFSFPAENPCTGEEGVLTGSPSTSVLHETKRADGTGSITGTSQGTATFVGSEGGPTFTGHFTAWFGGSIKPNHQIEHDTQTFVLAGPEGSHVVMHATGHLRLGPEGEVIVEVEKEHVHTKCV